MKDFVMIEVSGGVVVNTFSNKKIDVYIVDHDDLKQDDSWESALIPEKPDHIASKEITLAGMHNDLEKMYGTHYSKPK